MNKTLTRRFSTELPTNGKGLWSNEVRCVKVSSLHLCLMSLDNYDIEDSTEVIGELRVTFTKRSWNVSKHGLIYTDPRFVQALRAALKDVGFKGFSAVDYSEQGMQGDNYVSFDVGPGFIRSWQRDKILQPAKMY